jgi:hypothetical protein
MRKLVPTAQPDSHRTQEAVPQSCVDGSFLRCREKGFPEIHRKRKKKETEGRN